MAKPIVLVKEELLFKLADLHSLGVPISVLHSDIKEHISMPTLTKLINLYLDGERNIIFPKWLEEQEKVIAKQDSSKWAFIGKFPDGDWIKK